MTSSERQISALRSFACDHLRGAAAVAVLIVLPLGQIFQPRIAPVFVAVALLFCMFAQAVAPKGARWPGKITRPSRTRHLMTVFVGLAFIWGATTLLWGMDQAGGIMGLSSLALGIASCWYLGKQFSLIPHRRLPIVFLIGIGVSIIALLFSLTNIHTISALVNVPYEQYDYNRSAVALCLLLGVMFLLLKRAAKTSFLIAVLFLAASFSIFQSQSETAKLGLVVGTLSFLFVWVWPPMRHLVVISGAALLLLMPALVPVLQWITGLLPQALTVGGNATHRLTAWQGYGDAIYQKLLFGWGMRSDTLLGKTELVKTYAKQAGFTDDFSSPHNFALELWVNIGLIGITPLVVAIFLLGMRKNQDRKNDSVFAGLFASTFCMLLTGSSGFQGWLIAAGIIAFSTYTSLQYVTYGDNDSTD